jgi:hypothetical protein
VEVEEVGEEEVEVELEVTELHFQEEQKLHLFIL